MMYFLSLIVFLIGLVDFGSFVLVGSLFKVVGILVVSYVVMSEELSLLFYKNFYRIVLLDK